MLPSVNEALTETIEHGPALVRVGSLEGEMSGFQRGLSG